MAGTVLVINAGSSSVKFQLFDAHADGSAARRFRGQVDGIGSRPRLIVRDAGGATLTDRGFEPGEVPDAGRAQEIIDGWLDERCAEPPFAVGHRVVHGGPDYAAPVLLDEMVLADLERLVPLAPLHQPHNLAPIRALLRERPGTPQVACFDTAFHRTHPELADRFAIPEEFYRAGVRRYGFHGLSYEYVASRLAEVAPGIAGGRVVVLHLGSGASAARSWQGGASRARWASPPSTGCRWARGRGSSTRAWCSTSRRSGDGRARDRAAALLRVRAEGPLGRSGDVRDLLASGSPRARLALDYLAYRAAREVAGLAAAMGGIDGLVFTAGVGENAPEVRARICERCAWLGMRLDEGATAPTGPRSRPKARRCRPTSSRPTRS
jgi:acetate kinase